VTAAAPALRVERVSMRFGGVLALDDVSVDAHRARITCLLGDNGAGKSTLIRILAGVHRPTGGRCFVDGEPVSFDSPRHALERGIATVHQDLALIPLLSVWRNFFLGREPVRGAGPLRRIDVARCRDAARASLRRLGIELADVDRPVATLSGGERQCVAIARAIDAGARVLILDEPTAALGGRQAAAVLGFVAAARDQGIAVLLVTHDPQQAWAVGDDFVVLRHGRVLAAFARADGSLDDVARLMTGAPGTDAPAGGR
jgi:simple sugar transport system ATP-binding protein